LRFRCGNGVEAGVAADAATTTANALCVLISRPMAALGSQVTRLVRSRNRKAVVVIAIGTVGRFILLVVFRAGDANVRKQVRPKFTAAHDAHKQRVDVRLLGESYGWRRWHRRRRPNVGG
jgi:hypothetical protein